MVGTQSDEEAAYFGHSGLALNPNNPRDARRLQEERGAYQQHLAQQQQLMEFQLRQAQTRQALEATQADRAQREKELGEYHAGRLGEENAQREQGRMAHLGAFLSNPPPGTAPEELAAAKAQYYAYMGIPMGLSAEQREQNKVRQSQGLPPIQAPETATGARAPTAGGAVPTAGAAPTGGVPQPGGGTLPTTAYGYAPPNPNALIQHGTIVGGPPGFDLNVNTGRWIPSSAEGVINGRPAGEVNAELALRHGHTPESPSGQRAMARLTRPAPNVAASSGVPSTPTTAPTEQTTAHTAGGGSGAPVSAPGSGAPTAPAQPQRDLVPADYIGHYLGQAAGAVGSALGGAMKPMVQGFNASRDVNPPPFMPASLGPNAAAPGSTAQQPPPTPPAVGANQIRPPLPTQPPPALKPMFL